MPKSQYVWQWLAASVTVLLPVPPWAVHPASLSPSWPCSIPAPGQAPAHLGSAPGQRQNGHTVPVVVAPGAAICRSLGQSRIRRKCDTFIFLRLQLTKDASQDIPRCVGNYSFGFVCCALDQVLLERYRFAACVTSFGTEVHKHCAWHKEPLPSTQLLWISLLLFLFDTS